MKRMHILFVCSKNKWRSPTAEAIYRDDPRVSVRSRGTSHTAARKITQADLCWADIVLVMENKHRSRLLADFPGETRFMPIHVLDIEDAYQFMDQELQEAIRMATEPILMERIESDSQEPSSGERGEDNPHGKA